MRLSEEDKKCIKILYRNGLNVKEIEKLLNNDFSKDAIQKHIYRHLNEFRNEHIINRSLVRKMRIYNAKSIFVFWDR